MKGKPGAGGIRERDLREIGTQRGKVVASGSSLNPPGFGAEEVLFVHFALRGVKDLKRRINSTT